MTEDAAKRLKAVYLQININDMKTYYRLSPRGFANEDVILSVENNKEQNNLLSEMKAKYYALLGAYFKRISLKEAKQIITVHRQGLDDPRGCMEIVNILYL